MKTARNMTSEVIKSAPHIGAKINWKNIYPLPANTVGEKNFSWKDLPINRFIEKNGKRVRLKSESNALSEPSMATMANL